MDGSPAVQMSNRGHQCSVGIEFNVIVCNAIMKMYEHGSNHTLCTTQSGLVKSNSGQLRTGTSTFVAAFYQI